MGDDPEGSYGLRSLTLADKPIFDSFLSRTPVKLSDYTFATNFIWRQPTHALLAVLCDHLCLFANGQNGLTLMLPPVGTGDFASAVREAVTICRDYNRDHACEGNAAIEYVSTPIRDRFPKGYDVEPMSGDYVYSTEQMILLSGGDLAGKRHDCRRYANRYEAHTESFARQHIEPCLQLMARWRSQHADTADAVGEATGTKRGKDIEATAEAIRHHEALGLVGLVLYAGQELVGFTFGEMLGDDTCSIIIEKTDRGYAGSAQYIFNAFCRQAWAHTAWCNAGDDWDIPSLARTKESYRPAFRVEKWRMIPQPAVSVRVPVTAVLASREAPLVCSDATFDDIDELASLERRSFPVELAITRRQVRYLVKSPNASVRVVRQAGRVVASSVVLRQRTRRGVLSRLYSLAVDIDWRNRGLGRRLLIDALDRVRDEGIPSMSLEVAETNLPALRLYETLGFRQTQQLADYYGVGCHGVRMRLDVSDVPAAMAEA